MITVKQFADKNDISMMRVRQLIGEGRVAGAKKVGRDWVIPDRAVIKPPANPRGRPKK